MVTVADLAPIQPLLAPLNPGVDLTWLGGWCILPLCCGAFAAQAVVGEVNRGAGCTLTPLCEDGA